MEKKALHKTEAKKFCIISRAVPDIRIRPDFDEKPDIRLSGIRFFKKPDIRPDIRNPATQYPAGSGSGY